MKTLQEFLEQELEVKLPYIVIATINDYLYDEYEAGYNHGYEMAEEDYGSVERS